ncbi:hypothetical protein PHLGIDRAFT_19815 [Phlebiopsis gigantea 11061_1 CR5-6]|uniref:Uncharacterized protein n=1 Tax=Phlebiopsis gigantea (strain 11061_1 CR5-6) TaxID=745531 RepID=A0A0C3RV13_PHLG1|nr:hypothetical protein PHLGIDRAFT_19815 [Phlebiopsis gigantea 11061_1 CR5-6]
MCSQVLLVNRHRACQHNVPLWHNGETFDCNRPDCALSSAHQHPPTYPCRCNRAWSDYIRVSSIIQEQCDPCKEAATAALNNHVNRGRR